jgi:GGDEF domain-containing protein
LRARWGGDEFAIVAPNTVRRSAQQLAQRLLAHVAQEAKARDAAVTIEQIGHFPIWRIKS